MDPLEKQDLRQKMAARMQTMLEGASAVTCVSAHYLDEPAACDLCGAVHAHELLVVRNRAARNFRVAVGCLKEMVRFRVTEVHDLLRWLEKLKTLKSQAQARRVEQEALREQERLKLEKKVIVRKRGPFSSP